MAKIYPYDLRAEVRQLNPDAMVALMWEMKGPKNTDVAWLSCWVVQGQLIIVETFKSGGRLVLGGVELEDILKDTLRSVRE